MKWMRRFSAAIFSMLAVVSAIAANGTAFIANLKGDVVIDGTSSRPRLMTELGQGQKISLSKDAEISVMFILSGKEFVIKGPGAYLMGESNVAVIKGAAPAERQSEWRTSSKVLVQVGQTYSASIRMRGFISGKTVDKPYSLYYPVQGNVITLRPTFRWYTGNTKGPYDFVLFSGDKVLHKARVASDNFALPFSLDANVEYSWAVTAAEGEVRNGAFRTANRDDMAQAAERKPDNSAAFSDRLMYALMLYEMGAPQDAQEIWAQLAEERHDLPELAALARH
jgi:hypothetical protein